MKKSYSKNIKKFEELKLVYFKPTFRKFGYSPHYGYNALKILIINFGNRQSIL